MPSGGGNIVAIESGPSARLQTGKEERALDREFVRISNKADRDGWDCMSISPSAADPMVRAVSRDSGADAGELLE